MKYGNDRRRQTPLRPRAGCPHGGVPPPGEGRPRRARRGRDRAPAEHRRQYDVGAIARPLEREPDQGAARRPLDHLHGRLRGDERPPDFPDRGLLQRTRRDVRAAGGGRQPLLQLKEPTMKRLHVHIAVDDLNKSIGFYSTLFGAKPSVVKPDYAKWMLEDPKVNL